MAKRRASNQIVNSTPDHWKLGITLIYLHVGGVPHTIGNLSTRDNTLLQTSPQSEVCTRSYGPPKSWEFQFRKFQLGVLGQNDIWVQAPWLGTNNTIRGKVVASPKSRPWWVLWVHVCSWLICAPKVLQLCIKQLVVWFVEVFVNNWPTCQSS